MRRSHRHAKHGVWGVRLVVVAATAVFVVFSTTDLPVRGAELILAAAIHAFFEGRI